MQWPEVTEAFFVAGEQSSLSKLFNVQLSIPSHYGETKTRTFLAESGSNEGRSNLYAIHGPSAKL